MAKICMVAAQHPVDDSRVYDLEARTLAEQGHDVCIIARPVRGAKLDIPHYTVPEDNLGSVWHALKFALRADADVYHCHDVLSYPIGWLMKLRGKKVIFDIHERYELYLCPDTETSILGRLVVLFYLFLLFLFGWFIDGFVVAYDSLLWYRVFGKPVVVVLYFQRAADVRKPRRLGNPISLVYAGILRKDRGILVLPRFVYELSKRGHDVRLYIYGPFLRKEFEREFFNLVKKYGVTNVVRYSGNVPRDELLKVLSEYDIGLCLVRPTRVNKHILLRKMIEYIANGLPVIGAKGIYYFEKLVSEKGAGVAVEFGDVDGLVSAFEKIVKNYEKMSATAVRLAKEYVWDTQAEKLLTLYRSAGVGS